MLKSSYKAKNSNNSIDTPTSNVNNKVKKRSIPTVFAAFIVATGGLTLGTSTPVSADVVNDGGGSYNPVAIVDQLMSYPLKQFMRVRNSNSRPNLNWSTNICNFSMDSSLSFDFTNACIRHDFGYRNYKAYGLLTEDKRGDVDEIFYNDMKEHCNNRRSLRPLKADCYATAHTYYKMVRGLGELIP